MTYIEVQAMRKQASLGDAAALFGPGLAVGGGAWWLSGKVPWLKKQKFLRGLLAGGSGLATSIGMGVWNGKRIMALQKALKDDAESQGSLRRLVDYTMGKDERAPVIKNFGQRIFVQ